MELLEDRLVPTDVSAPVILQWFDGSYRTIERRAADLFAAGYGSVYTPPPGRADSGNFSVGYDVYDRFDLGSPGNPTLYGTETGLKTAIDAIHRLGGSYYLDFVANHNGFSNLGTPGFVAAGGYPGFAITLNASNNSQGINDIDGDFHGAFEGGDIRGRLAGLIDIAQEKNYPFIRSPVDPGDARNLPAGTTLAFGRLANVPDPNNRRFYPDQGLAPIFLFDPATGEQNIPIYPFNTANPLAGDLATENGMGYLMRNAQWLVQVIGADGLRLDAAKHFERFVLNFLDRAVYRQNPRPLLDGSTNHVFSFSEVFDGDKGFLQSFIRDDINPADPGRIGGNRDVLDFPLFFAMKSNLSANGFQNNWFNIRNASQDSQDDGLANNGSQGVAFVSSHDEFGPYLSNVAYAYTLMRPGNAIVYFNGKEFGPDRDFPKDGRGDALGGLFGDTIKRLVDIRNTRGRGNYIERFIEKEFLIFEREDSALVVLSNRLDGGFDSRTVQTSFAPGTPLIELTGNAADPIVDPFNDFPELLVVQPDGKVNLRVPRNKAPGANGVEHGRGYFVYGPATPQGTLSLTNVHHTIAAQTATAATNGTARLSALDVIAANSFQVRLDTNAVNLLGFFRDRPADGDNALIKLDGGRDVNASPGVDFVQPGAATYGFERFTTVHSPGFLNADGNGQYVQAIDATTLSEGVHFLDVRAFRHREPGEGPEVFTDFRRSVYIDRLPPSSAVVGFGPITPGVNENRRLTVRSTDLTADNVYVFFDLPAALTDEQVRAMVGGGSQASQIDRDLWTKDAGGLTHGNHVATVVTFEISGNVNVQCFPGLFTSTIFGAGLGDLDFDGDFDAADVGLFGTVLESSNAAFNPAADLNADGLVNNTDLLLLHGRLEAVGASAATLAAYRDLLGPPAAGFSIREGESLHLTASRPTVDVPPLTFTWDLNDDGMFGDVTGATAARTWAQLDVFGIRDNGSYALGLRVSDGATTVALDSTLTVGSTAPTAGLSGPASLLFGQPGAFTLTATDPASPDEEAGFTYQIDWGDGSPPQTIDPTPGNGSGLIVAHSFLASGDLTVRLTATDKDGATSEAVFRVVSVCCALTIDDVSQPEGDAGSADAVFAVRLSAVSSLPVTVRYATVNGTALAGSDYTAVSGTLTFAPGQMLHAVRVPVRGDTAPEAHEFFSVVLSSPGNAALLDDRARGTILNDDPVALRVNDVAVSEGSGGATPAVFTVRLNGAGLETVTVDYATADNSARAAADYAPASGTLTFAPGETAHTLTVAVAGDVLDENSESFFVRLGNPVGAPVADGQGSGTILDDDDPPLISISDATVVEGAGGFVDLVFTVMLSAPSGKTVSVSFATQADTATAGDDYVATSGVLVFAPGVTQRTVTVRVKGDTLHEGNERLFVDLAGVANALLGNGRGTGTIRDDD